MSLMDKSINFDSTILGLATAIYTVIKPIFKDAILDTDNTTVYFDSNKQDGFKITGTTYVTISYIVQNQQTTYNYRKISTDNFSTLYYNISTNKDMIAFGLTPGILDFGMGYEEKIGFWEFFIGVIGTTTTAFSEYSYLFITDKKLSKHQIPNTNNCTRWQTSSTYFNISLVQLPLFVVSGNFNSLFEVVSNYSGYQFNKQSVIYSNNKYYRLIQSSNTDYSINGSRSTVILAMEVADD